MYTNICVCTHIYSHTYICALSCVCSHMYLYIHTSSYMCVTHTYVHTSIYSYTLIYTCTHIHSYMYTRAYSYIHTYISSYTLIYTCDTHLDIYSHSNSLNMYRYILLDICATLMYTHTYVCALIYSNIYLYIHSIYTCVIHT